MLPVRRHARSLLSLPVTAARRCNARQIKNATEGLLRLLKRDNPTSESLHRTGLWNYKTGPKPKGDRARVNVTDGELCDAIIDQNRESLLRHQGCDLVDMFPGCGVWSRKLTDLLQPRSHIMLEPDADLYKPFLEPLLARPNTQLLPKSGILWHELDGILTPEFLPNQVKTDQRSPNGVPRNDTLLVTANFSWHPKKRFASFSSVAQLLFYQFICSIRPGSLFQKYGQVRMLIWIMDSEKRPYVPQNMQSRQKASIESEMLTEWVHELAGLDVPDPKKVDLSQEGVPVKRSASDSTWFVRDESIELDSAQKVVARMRERGIVTPPGRETRLAQKVRARADEPPAVAGEGPIEITRAFYYEYEKMRALFEEGEIQRGSPQHKRMLVLGSNVRVHQGQLEVFTAFIKEYDEIIALYVAAAAESPDSAAKLAEAKRKDAEWNEKLSRMPSDMRNQVILCRDNLHVYRQNPPLLAWDRREIEPLVVKPTDFFPNVPLSLLDVQPKAISPHLRGRDGDVLDQLMKGLYYHSTLTIDKALNTLAPGAADGVLPNCPSIYDPSKSGVPVGGMGTLAVRSLNERQILEVLDGWLKWDFRPSYTELVARTSEALEGEDDQLITDV
ncbi:hypothetical protein B0T26DRAFT_718232 [Lasiosphaeria miniovina]|uniref:Mitochondrial transcription factor 1 n=1 Tax=Lasiosphaeria miniovina TaxID=1954250 RepID=A0AA40ADM4_9PEZI|nr:uncharacterized protein B0T26DRAFT_718232 [Lasiosphaeria miniovina]KAK0713743.1 hypothetical protein B0T26DRAFT_718232 [Lasiosphaeria miniovina]